MIGNNFKFQRRAGATLIEVMVSVAIFAVLMISAAEIFKAVNDGQRSAIAAQNLQESMRYALETMAKEVRAAAASSGSECSSLFGKPAATDQVFNTADGGTFFYFKNKNQICVAYSLENGRLKITRGTDSGYITPQGITVDELNFSAQDDNFGVTPRVTQPRVTMEMELEANGQAMHKQRFRLQTTISARYYE